MCHVGFEMVDDAGKPSRKRQGWGMTPPEEGWKRAWTGTGWVAGARRIMASNENVNAVPEQKNRCGSIRSGQLWGERS